MTVTISISISTPEICLALVSFLFYFSLRLYLEKRSGWWPHNDPWGHNIGGWDNEPAPAVDETTEETEEIVWFRERDEWDGPPPNPADWGIDLGNDEVTVNLD